VADMLFCFDNFVCFLFLLLILIQAGNRRSRCHRMRSRDEHREPGAARLLFPKAIIYIRSSGVLLVAARGGTDGAPFEADSAHLLRDLPDLLGLGAKHVFHDIRRRAGNEGH